MNTMITIGLLAFVQSVSFTMTSRAKNRDNMWYNGFCAILSNGIWLLTMRTLVVNDISYDLFAPYIFGTACGSMFGANIISMRVERWLGSTTDSNKASKT